MAELLQDTARRISDQEWEQKCEKFLLPTQDLNSLVMNFLTTEVGSGISEYVRETSLAVVHFVLKAVLILQGYLDAARTFEVESGTLMDHNVDRSEERMYIRNAVEHGELQSAISQLNDLNPEVRHPPTHRSHSVHKSKYSGLFDEYSECVYVDS